MPDNWLNILENHHMNNEAKVYIPTEFEVTEEKNDVDANEK